MKHKINIIILFLLVYIHTVNAYGKEINVLPITIQVVDPVGKPVANVVVYYALSTARPSVF